MMNRLRCTYTELLEQPFEELEIFMAFAEGEVAGERSLQEQAKAAA